MYTNVSIKKTSQGQYPGSDFNCNEIVLPLELKMEFWHKKPFSISPSVHKW